MRTTDDLNPERFQPLGERVTKPTAKPAPAPHSKPQGEYGVVTMPDGTLRTTRDHFPRSRP